MAGSQCVFVYSYVKRAQVSTSPVSHGSHIPTVCVSHMRAEIEQRLDGRVH